MSDDAPWYHDVLGDDWVARDLALPAGAVATLVSHRPGTPATDNGPTTSSPDQPDSARPAVLYLHGFVDYFFHTHVADAVTARGYPFYALDLRGYGRSIGRGSGAPVRHNDDPNFVTDLSVYAQDLDAAVRAIADDGHDDVVLLAHSAGGLIASLWAHARPGRLAALVLNSPWLDLNSHWFDRVVSTRAVDVLGVIAPRVPVGSLGVHWGRALHQETGGEWDYNLDWKPHGGFPVRAGWLREIRRGHARVARGLDIDCPVLVLSSARTGPHTRWHPDLLTTDSVLDTTQIRARAPLLGPAVTQVTIPDGAHDLALSPEPARSRYTGAVLDWLDSVVSESR